MKVWQQKPKNVGSTQEKFGRKNPKTHSINRESRNHTPIIYTWFDVIHRFVEENT
jgi:hypothetical protein